MVPSLERAESECGPRETGEPHSLWPPVPPPPKPETKQMQSRNKGDASQAHAVPRPFPQKPVRVAARRKLPGSPGRLVSCDGVNKNNYDALITALIAAELVLGGGG